jgi:ABC-type nickel/cobalt efflux system permease component RcnA
MFETESFIGLALIALWIYVRFPERRPQSLMHAIARVVLAFGLFMVLPFALLVFHSIFPGHTAGVAFLLAVAMPLLCGVLLSFIWLLARVLHDYGPDLPSGGHPATNGA